MWLLPGMNPSLRRSSPALSLLLMSVQVVTAATSFTMNVDKCLQEMPGHISTARVCLCACAREQQREIGGS